MTRVVGQYKDKEIVVEALHLEQTYADILVGKKDDKWLNREIINVKVDKKVHELFGLHPPYLIVDHGSIDYEKPLPPEIVFVLLECWEPIERGDGSCLVLVWLQEPDQDPFSMVGPKLETVDWAKEARDFEV